MAQALNGQLRDFSLPDVLQFILQQRKSGRLVLVYRGIRAEVGISRGNISHVEVDGRSVETVLRDWLLAVGRLSPEEYQGIEQLSEQMDRSILETLVAKKFISPEERSEWVQLVAEDLICELFHWSDGSYEFNTDLPATSSRGIGLNLSTEMVTMEGMRRLDEWPRLRERLSSGSRIQVTLATAPPADLEPGPEALILQVLGSSGERCPLDELESKVPFGTFRLYDTIVAYADAGYITLHQDGRSFESMPVMESNEEPSHRSSPPILVAAAVIALILAFLFNWVATTTIGHLSTLPSEGFAGAELRFESQKLHTAVLRYRFLTGQWPSSLERAEDVFPLTKSERSSSIGLNYGFQTRDSTYSLWLRDRPSRTESP